MAFRSWILGAFITGISLIGERELWGGPEQTLINVTVDEAADDSDIPEQPMVVSNGHYFLVAFFC